MCPEYYINQCRKLFSFSVICYQTVGVPHISRTLWNILPYIVLPWFLPCNSEPSCQKRRTKFGLFPSHWKYRRSDAGNIGSVCLMVREKIGLQTDGRTDRHGEYISVFFSYRKKTLKIATKTLALVGITDFI